MTSTPKRCPFCGSTDTSKGSDFGTSLMVAMHYCRHCKSHFEAIKWGEREELDVPSFLAATDRPDRLDRPESDGGN